MNNKSENKFVNNFILDEGHHEFFLKKKEMSFCIHCIKTGQETWCVRGKYNHNLVYIEPNDYRCSKCEIHTLKDDVLNLKKGIIRVYFIKGIDGKYIQTKKYKTKVNYIDNYCPISDEDMLIKEIL